MLKNFFSSRLEKYIEADDGKYRQDYLTRGELELVDRYKECRELSKILLEDNIEPEIPQDCIKKETIREKIKELKSREFYQNFPEDYLAEISINILKELINEQ